MQEMKVCFQLGAEKIMAEVGYYERLFAMLISGLEIRVDMTSRNAKNEFV